MKVYKFTDKFTDFRWLNSFFLFFSTLPGEHERDVGNLCSIARESRRQNIQQQNSGCNFDQSSIAEKTRRAKERNNEEETGDLNGAPLWQKQNKPTI